MSELEPVADHDRYHDWGAMGQRDDLTFALVVSNRRTGRQRRVIITRDFNGHAAIVEIGRWSIERPRTPARFGKLYSRPPPIMAAERLRCYGVEGTQRG